MTALSSTLVFARRHVSTLVYIGALLGVPLAVIVATGGLHTVGFWAMAVAWLPVAMIGVMPLGVILFVPLAIVAFLLDEVLPRASGDDRLEVTPDL